MKFATEIFLYSGILKIKYNWTSDTLAYTPHLRKEAESIVETLLFLFMFTTSGVEQNP
jgi:hypothetical protein